MLGVSSAIENLLPPFPGDTITVFGAYLAGLGFLDPVLVFGCTAAGNLATNIFVYYLGRANGREFIKNHPRMFHPELLPRVALFYRKWGMGTLFISRFLVGFRSVIPLFAGVSRFRLRRFLVPVIFAIAIQHALLVYFGFYLGQNWAYIKTILKELNLGLGAVAAVLAVLVFLWFRKMRKSGRRAGRKKVRRDKPGE
ncbi:MAG TPA: DedA family protein [archaeon]|nr:DedA family protein [archaeon]